MKIKIAVLKSKLDSVFGWNQKKINLKLLKQYRIRRIYYKFNKEKNEPILNILLNIDCSKIYRIFFSIG